jgi:hypothetical protein
MVSRNLMFIVHEYCRVLCYNPDEEGGLSWYKIPANYIDVS